MINDSSDDLVVEISVLIGSGWYLMNLRVSIAVNINITFKSVQLNNSPRLVEITKDTKADCTRFTVSGILDKETKRSSGDCVYAKALKSSASAKYCLQMTRLTAYRSQCGNYLKKGSDPKFFNENQFGI